MVTAHKPFRRDWLISRGKLPRSFATKAHSYGAVHDPNSKLTEVVSAAKEVQSKRWILQLINSAEYTEKTESWMKMLDWHIRSFVVSTGQYCLSAHSDESLQLEGTITLELTVYVRAPITAHALPPLHLIVASLRKYSKDWMQSTIGSTKWSMESMRSRKESMS